jgi:opacity protein-like surface antigen
MKSFAARSLVCLGVSLAVPAAAFAQGNAEVAGKYIGGFAQSAFGNVTSQSFGAEAGFGVAPQIEVFIEGGRTVDAAPASMGAAAQQITVQIQKTAPNASYTVKQPVDFVDAGVRYEVDIHSKLMPYVLAGVGIGMVKPDAQFAVNGASVNATLAQYGVALGSDLTGTTSKFMAVGGAGARYPLGTSIYADLEFRYNRVFISGRNIPFSRAGIGLGFKF